MVALSPVLTSYLAHYAASTAVDAITSCNISALASHLNLPTGQSQLALPTTSTPSFVGLAFGVQNYTCTQSNNFTNVGAVAELVDISCVASKLNTDVLDTIQDPLFAFWESFSGASIQDLINFFHVSDPPEILAQHYFVTNPFTGEGLSPKWDFTSSGRFKGKANAFIIAKGKGNIPAPTNSTRDVAWLDVVRAQGDIADEVFRTDTRGGQPPASCVFGQTQDISVKYVSKYWFFGGKLH